MSNTTSNNKKNNAQAEQDDWFGELLGSLLQGLLRLLWWGIRFPLLGGPIFVSLVVGYWQGSMNAGFLTLIGFVALYGFWAMMAEDSFQRWVIDPPTHYYRRWSRYLSRWEKVCTACGLTMKYGERELIPTLQSVSIGEHTDVLHVSVVTGQSIANWLYQRDALAAAFKADRLTITATAPDQIRIAIMRGDVLAEPVPVSIPEVGATVDLSAVPVGVTEHHRVWTLPMLGNHVLIAAATGGGKSGVLQSVIAGLAPDVHSGRVRLCVIDPKGGMELGPNAPMFSFFSHDATGRTLELLRALVEIMQERANRLRGTTRLHTPTIADPLFVVVIDEIAALTAYVSDRKIKTEIEHLLGLLLTQGRAVGITVVAAVQDPSKDTLPVRQLFTVRIALRMTEASQTAMVLGQGAKDAGAHCEQIPDTTPGVGYVMIDGTATPARVRAFWVTDYDIAYLVRTFPAPRPRKPRKKAADGDHSETSQGQNNGSGAQDSGQL